MKSISEKVLEKIESLISSNKSEAEIIAWIESQKNAQDIFEWFNQFMQGYADQPEGE